MEQRTTHWDETLMGREFWEDATQHEEMMRQQLATQSSRTAYPPFPKFHVPQSAPPNIDHEQSVSAQTQRRLSMSDVGKTDSQQPSAFATGIARFKAFERRVRSPSPRKMMASSINALTSWRLSPVSSSDRRPRRSSPIKQAELPPPPGPSEVVHTEEVSSPLATSSPQQTMAFMDDFATAAKPWMGFRGGAAWDVLSRAKHSLGLDLYSPRLFEEEEDDESPLKICELKPLLEFRQLRSLKLTGMLRSRQRDIWQAVWLMVELEELALEMALEPEIVHPQFASEWKLIDEDWILKKVDLYKHDPSGQAKDGQLRDDIGFGEYLDKHCMEKANILAMAMGRTRLRLTLKHLTLSGFVVDADPFFVWFDPRYLCSIQFKGKCYDAGFWLPKCMGDVVVSCPSPADLQPVAVPMVPVNAFRDLKVEDGTSRPAEPMTCPAQELEGRALYDFF
ncbi:hypothetical protein PDE_05985 [Penicillium oxalicum 114-2]|uniref:Uncharacterized protein n=1 Tax=Penicillium oxalicum (strain 114-2 / CGMCC 5302) TaxID=933388 RepID=S7ZQU3_PENO1|nr:hypothetical protein PDE_05985 [Penicillium oxalicum 114-2]